MPTAKEQLRHVLDSLPDDCTIDDVVYKLYLVLKDRESSTDPSDDVLYRLYLTAKVREAEEDFRRGDVYTQEEIEAEYKEWLSEK